MSKTGRKGRLMSNLLHGKTWESFMVGLLEILFKMALGILFILSMVVLAVFSLLCLALDWQTAAMVFGIALLSVTFLARSICWTQWMDPVDTRALDLIVGAEVAYLVLIKQGFTIFNCFVVSSSVAIAYFLLYISV